MRQPVGTFLAFTVVGTVLMFVAQAMSQRPARPGSQNNRSDRDVRRPDNRRPSGPGRGGFNPPPPPVLTALDANNDGEISAEEIAKAVAALKKLDKNKDGELAGNELLPDFGPGGRGRGGFGPDSGGDRVAPEKLSFADGVASIPDHATYHKLSYRGEEVLIDTFLADLEFVKFTLDRANTEQRKLYFINTKTHRAHMMFGRVAGLPRGRGDEQMKGVLVYRPMLKSPSGKPGLYTFEFEPFDAYTFEMVKLCHDMLASKMPVLKGNIGYYPRGNGALQQAADDREKYKSAGLAVYRDDDLVDTDVAFLPLNHGSTFGRLRLMNLNERPTPRDVVLYETLPNEMPRVSGIITAVRQTPLSHVNLRAVQDQVPNSFITDAARHDLIKPLVGKLVAYSVTADGFSIREATREEVEKHFAAMRPTEPQIPARDLSVKTVQPLGEITFKDSDSVGVKAANIATLRSFGFKEGTVPDGFAVPFYFYDEFMKHNGFYDYAKMLLASPKFQKDRTTQIAELKKFRKLIKNGKMPKWMMVALDDVHKKFREGTSVRCRSSTNNEDLPGFSGAGLYDSYTHKPDEGHFSKSIKQVYASLWNFRAYEEREFYRVDHFLAAMGVLLHPSFKGELANGVAVTDDILYQTYRNYYLNTQVGEDLITNPEEESVPEEVLLGWHERDGHRVMRDSNRVEKGKQILSYKHLAQLRGYLAKIHGRFSKLYGSSLNNDKFAMEIEFKVTRDGSLSIKQARPWVFTKKNAKPVTETLDDNASR